MNTKPQTYKFNQFIMFAWSEWTTFQKISTNASIQNLQVHVRQRSHSNTLLVFLRAAITIQRAWRDYKGLPDPAEEETDLDKILSPLPYGATTTSLSVQQSSAAGTKSSQQLNKDSQSTTRSRISNKVSVCLKTQTMNQVELIGLS